MRRCPFPDCSRAVYVPVFFEEEKKRSSCIFDLPFLSIISSSWSYTYIGRHARQGQDNPPTSKTKKTRPRSKDQRPKRNWQNAIDKTQLTKDQRPKIDPETKTKIRWDEREDMMMGQKRSRPKGTKTSTKRQAKPRSNHKTRHIRLIGWSVIFFPFHSPNPNPSFES
jgi:hypothetical protein